MTYHTLCFYCSKSLELRKAIIVKEALSRTFLHKYHPECYLELTKDTAGAKLAYNQLRGAMQNAHDQVQAAPRSRS